MSWTITSSNLLVDDADALAYLTAVETTDGQPLESGVRLAVNAFVKGCKADGIWPALKASCILAGARTRFGALTPLVGTAPTSFNFVDGDYDRKTGLVGNGSTKYLDSNRNVNADPQNSFHCSIYSTQAGSIIASEVWLGTTSAGGRVTISSSFSPSSMAFRNRNATAFFSSAPLQTLGFSGSSRNSAEAYTVRTNQQLVSVTQSSTAAANESILLYRQPGVNPFYAAARFAFYSIGTSLDLALLDARVTTLINAFGAAIP